MTERPALLRSIGEAVLVLGLACLVGAAIFSLSLALTAMVVLP